MRDSTSWIFTYAKSQKMKNLALLFEAGPVTMRPGGAMLVSRSEIHRDPETIVRGEELLARHGSAGAATPMSSTSESATGCEQAPPSG
jgi:hypothetical protein